MYNMFKLFGSIACFYLVSPVLTHYIFDDNPNGYLYAAEAVEDFGKNRMPTHKMFYKGNNQNLKLLNERTLDLHFKTQRTSPMAFSDVTIDHMLPNVLSAGSANNHRESKTRNSPKPEHIYEDVDNNYKTTTNRNEILSPIKDLYFTPNKNLDPMKGIYNENQGNVKLNHYRVQPSFDIKKNSAVSNRKFNSNEQKPVYGSEKHEMSSHKTTDRYSKETPRASDNQQRPNANILKQDENRKRDIAGIQTVYPESSLKKDNEKFVSFNGGLKQGLHLAKHIDEKVERNYRNKSPSRIGKYSIKTKPKTKPYALFYVMNHENFDQPERILSEEVKSYDQEPINNFYNSVTNYKKISNNHNINNYAVFRDR